MAGLDRITAEGIAWNELITDRSRFLDAIEDVIDTLAHADLTPAQLAARSESRATEKQRAAIPALKALMDLASLNQTAPNTLTDRERAIAQLIAVEAYYWLSCRSEELMSRYSPEGPDEDELYERHRQQLIDDVRDAA